MNTQWNTIKNLKFKNKNVFRDAETFGEIEEDLLHEDPEMDHNGKIYTILRNRSDNGIIYDVQATDESFSDEDFKRLYRAYPTVEALVMNYVFEDDGMSFIDFMMAPDEDLEY